MPGATHSTSAQLVGDVLVERYRYLPGPAGAGPTHVHEEWQWCLYVGGPGSYVMGSRRIVFPSGTLTVVAPGQSHAAQDPEDRRRPSACLVVYVRTAAGTHGGLIVDDERARSMFARLWGAHDRLEADVALGAFFSEVGSPQRPAPGRPSARSLGAVRDYLHAHATDRVRLADLSAVAALSPAHLVRVFSRTYGLPPHRYQTALRIDRAKRLLAAGEHGVGEVGLATGFADHAHFARTFRRWVGLPPSRYAKIVQDGARPVRLNRAV